MTTGMLGQYFRSFLVKLNMVESQLGQLGLGGQDIYFLRLIFTQTDDLADSISFAIVIELKDNNVPSTITNGVRLFASTYLHVVVSDFSFQEPPPWMPAEIQHTTYGASKSAELSMIRAVNTGVINVSRGALFFLKGIHLVQLSLAVQESEEKLNKEKELTK